MATPLPIGFRVYLMLTTAVCGALVMVVEVLGSRVIGPFFGVSLFVWTALISVALLSLAVGYVVGGAIADRHPTPGALYTLILASGVLVALVPLLKEPVIALAQPLGLRAGALCSAAVLFAPGLFLLGCVSPYVVRIATREWSSLGRTVGLLYALSTAGSFVGTAGTGFFLIAYLGVTQAYYLAGALLCLLGAGYFALFQRRPLFLGLLLPFALISEPALPSATLPDGTEVRLIDRADSFYGNVRVAEYAGGALRTREMKIDGQVQGGIDVTTGESVYEYTYLLSWLPGRIKTDPKRVLVVGLGAGIIPGDYERQGARTTAVEIDDQVVHMARKHFALSPTVDVVLDDARYFLAQDGNRFDVVIMDAFSGDTMPSHLLSREALQRIKARLVPDGVVALNVAVSTDPASPLAPAILRTLQSEFEQVALFPLFEAGDHETFGGNLVILARNGSIDGAFGPDLPVTVHALAREGVAAALARGHRAPPQVPGIVLTDDYNPLDLLDIPLHEHMRRNIVTTTPRAILLHG